MKIIGIEGMTTAEVQSGIDQGGKFVLYTYCISLLIITMKRPTDVYYIKPGENSVVKGLPWVLLTLVLGWWGFPGVRSAPSIA